MGFGLALAGMLGGAGQAGIERARAKREETKRQLAEEGLLKRLEMQQAFQANQNALTREHQISRDEADRSYRTSEREAAQDFQAGIVTQKIDANRAAKTAKDADGVTRYVETGEPVFESDLTSHGNLSSDDVKEESTLRKEYEGLAPVKEFDKIDANYRRMRASVQDPSASGDIALIFNFMKMLDPQSVVREGEFATAENAGGVPQRITSIYNKMLNGERLTAEVRQDFFQRAEKLYGAAVEQIQSINSRYGELAKQYGYDGSRITRNIPAYEPLIVNTNQDEPARDAPEGVDPQLWKMMTPEERALWQN